MGGVQLRRAWARSACRSARARANCSLPQCRCFAASLHSIAFFSLLGTPGDEPRLHRVVLRELCTVMSFLRTTPRCPTARSCRRTLVLHNLLEHVALVLVELDSRHAEYVVLQAVGASTKTRLIMVSLDDYSTTILIMRPSILTRSMEPVHQGSGRKERTHARTRCCGTSK